MKVLITNFHPGDGGGHTTYIESLIRGAAKKIEFTIASPSTSKLCRIASKLPCRYAAIDFPGKLREIRGILRARAALLQLIKTSSFDIIHVNGSPDHRLIMYCLLGFLRSSHRPKIIFTKHNSFAVKGNLFTRLRYRYFCDAVVTVCKMFEHELGILMQGKPVFVIENGVDLEKYKPGDECSGIMLRKKLGLPSDSFLFVSCAGTAEHKGWHLLAEVVKNHNNTYLVLLGHEPKRQKLVKLFGGESNIPDNLIFAGLRDNVVPFLQGADVGFVLSTGVETISFACREMMACGLPVLVSDFGCLKHNVTSSTGWVTRAGSLSSIESAVSDILRGNLVLMGSNARKRAVSNFDELKFIDNSMTVYEQLAASRKF